VFYLAVLPQFLTPGGGLGWLLVLAWSHAALSLAYLLALITGLHSARHLLTRRKVRRSLDATTGAVLLGFSAKLATEHVYDCPPCAFHATGRATPQVAGFSLNNLPARAGGIRRSRPGGGRVSRRLRQKQFD